MAKAVATMPEAQTVSEKIKNQGYIGAREAAKLVGVHVITVYRWIEGGELQGMKVLNRHFILRTSLAKKVGLKAAVMAGIITEAEAKTLV